MNDLILPLIADLIMMTAVAQFLWEQRHFPGDLKPGSRAGSSSN